jgi:hypothetical protein
MGIKDRYEKVRRLSKSHRPGEAAAARDRMRAMEEKYGFKPSSPRRRYSPPPKPAEPRQYSWKVPKSDKKRGGDDGWPNFSG